MAAVISLEDCFSLGQAIREGNAEIFLILYDQFEGVNKESRRPVSFFHSHQKRGCNGPWDYCDYGRLNQLPKCVPFCHELHHLKELSRQISDLPTPLFNILQSKHVEKSLSSIYLSSKVPIDLIDICNNVTIMSDSGVCSDDFEQEQEEKREVLTNIQTNTVDDKTKQDSSKQLRLQRRVLLPQRQPVIHVSSSRSPYTPSSGLRQSKQYKTDHIKRNHSVQYASRENTSFDHEKAVEYLWKRWSNVKRMME